jgi:hypothetical protein
MRPNEPRSFTDERALDPCNEDQVRAWALYYEVPVQEIRDVCAEVGGNRTAVELKLSAPRV